MKMKKVVLTLGLAIMITSAFAQCKEWKWPEDGALKAKAEEKVTLYTDYKNAKDFRKAATALHWLLVNTPDLNTSIYINGADIFDGLASAEKDAAKKAIYIDSLMLMYDLRIQYCNEEASVVNRKAFSAFKHKINTPGKEGEIMQIMEKTLELNGNNTLDATLVPYMQTVMFAKLRAKSLTDDQVLSHYDRVMSIVSAKTKKLQSEGKPVDKINEIKDQVDEILLKTVKVDCEFVRTKLGPKFKQNKQDMDLAKKIFAFMLRDKCTDDPLWLEAAEAIHNVEKDFGLAKNLGIRYLAMENYDKATQMFKEALELTSNGADKADVLIYIGSIEAKNGSKSSARQTYLQALSADPSKKDAYEKIGDLYMTSFKDCSKEKSYAEDRLIYIAAYEMYAKAGNAQKMAQAKAQFPSTTELFEVGWNEGDVKKIDCWVGESVTLKTRGKE